MTQPLDSLFDTGLERYKAGEEPKDLIPVFKEICDRAPKTGPAWTCLAWLYMLDDKPAQAYKAAQKAVKLNPHDPQTRINLAIAMLENGQKGVREHVEEAQRQLAANPELEPDIQENLEEGLTRKPDWKSLSRVKQWLFEL